MSSVENLRLTQEDITLLQVGLSDKKLQDLIAEMERKKVSSPTLPFLVDKGLKLVTQCPGEPDGLTLAHFCAMQSLMQGKPRVFRYLCRGLDLSGLIGYEGELSALLYFLIIIAKNNKVTGLKTLEEVIPTWKDEKLHSGSTACAAIYHAVHLCARYGATSVLEHLNQKHDVFATPWPNQDFLITGEAIAFLATTHHQNELYDYCVANRWIQFPRYEPTGYIGVGCCLHFCLIHTALEANNSHVLHNLILSRRSSSFLHDNIFIQMLINSVIKFNRIDKLLDLFPPIQLVSKYISVVFSACARFGRHNVLIKLENRDMINLSITDTKPMLGANNAWFLAAYCAIEYRNKTMLDFLLREHGVDLFAYYSEGTTLLDHLVTKALDHGCIDILFFLADMHPNSGFIASKIEKDGVLAHKIIYSIAA